MGSMNVSLNLFVSNHFSTVASFPAMVEDILDTSFEAALKTSNNSTYFSRCNKSIRNFFLFASVAVKNCKLAFVF